jgi:hypothetical protein
MALGLKIRSEVHLDKVFRAAVPYSPKSSRPHETRTSNAVASTEHDQKIHILTNISYR